MVSGPGQRADTTFAEKPPTASVNMEAAPTGSTDDDEEEDGCASGSDDDLLGLPSFEKLSAGIHHALTTQRVVHRSHATSRPEEEDMESSSVEREEDEEETEEEEEEEKKGAGSRKENAVQVATSKRPETGRLHWRPRVEFPKQRDPERVVHRRGPESADKETGLAKQVNLLVACCDATWTNATRPRALCSCWFHRGTHSFLGRQLASQLLTLRANLGTACLPPALMMT